MPPRSAVPADSYWRLSRAPRYSLLFALPLLALYEGLAALLGHAGGSQVRNGAEVLLSGALAVVAGPWAGVIVVALVVLGCIVFAGIDMRRNRGKLRGRVFGWMLAESAVLAMACGFIVSAVTVRLLNTVGPRLAILAAPTAQTALAWPTRLMLSLGAGLWEELVFRVLLVGAIALGLRSFAGMGVTVAGLIASVVGALVFSAAHYIGAYGDPFTVQSFTFRAIAGLFFSVLFVFRGFGIAAWTHALYDVLVLVIR